MQKLKNNRAFSFIELIMVISIISIIGFFGISSFSDQIDNLKVKSTLGKIISNIDNLDNKISSRKIFDYETIFEKNKNYYLVNENIFDLDNKLELTGVNNGIGSFEIIGGNNTGSGTFKEYFGYKFIKKDIKAGAETFTGNISKIGNYKFEATYSGSTLNNLYINYFDKQNMYKLVRINPNTGPDLDKIIIKNILGKKQFGNTDSINKIILTFEDELGKRETLEIKK